MSENAKSGERLELTFDELSRKVIGAALQVHRQLGPGFLESAYEQALRIELAARGLAFEAQKPVQLRYAGQVIGNHVLDLIVDGRLILELKAVSGLEDVHFAQLRSYLRATGVQVGLLINFNSARLEIRRVVHKYVPDDQ